MHVVSVEDIRIVACPTLFLNVDTGGNEVSCHRKELCEGRIGGGFAQHTGRVANRNAQCPRCLRVNVIISNTDVGNYLKIRRTGDHFCCYRFVTISN